MAAPLLLQGPPQGVLLSRQELEDRSVQNLMVSYSANCAATRQCPFISHLGWERVSVLYCLRPTVYSSPLVLADGIPWQPFRLKSHPTRVFYNLLGWNICDGTAGTALRPVGPPAQWQAYQVHRTCFMPIAHRTRAALFYKGYVEELGFDPPVPGPKPIAGVEDDYRHSLIPVESIAPPLNSVPYGGTTEGTCFRREAYPQ
jgi:hypothetical protein